MTTIQRIMSEFVPTGADDHSRLVALMTGILVLMAGMGGALIFIGMICIKKKVKKYARRRLLRRDSASRLSFSTPSPSIEELGDEMWTPLPEDALKRRRVDVILQPVHTEHDETTSNGTNGFVPTPEDEDGDVGEELHAEDDANATLDEEEHEGGGDEDEDRSAYRLCYNDLDMYRSDEDQTADEGSGYLDEEEGYMHELEQWSEDFLLSEMGGSSSTSDLHRLTQPLPPGTRLVFLFVYLFIHFVLLIIAGHMVSRCADERHIGGGRSSTRGDSVSVRRASGRTLAGGRGHGVDRLV
jgi:hypothetical protein